jgi:inner membrane transporter RhtA
LYLRHMSRIVSQPPHAGVSAEKPASEGTPVAARRGSAIAVLLVVVVGMSMQAGSAVAVLVIDSVGVFAALWLRTAFSALILALLRPRCVRLPAREDRILLLMLTLSLVGMNLSFYEAISRAPVGIVVAVEFLGPLGVAVAGSRRWLDAVWVILAGGGVVLLAPLGGSVGLLGLMFALAAAACWAAFILLAKKTVARMEPVRVTTLMLVGASVVVTPIWLGTGVRLVGQGQAVLLGLAVAVLSSALPYMLELVAIGKVRAGTYSVFLSIEPAIAALMGFAILAQGLTVLEMAGIAAIVLAAAGAGWFSGVEDPTRRTEGSIRGPTRSG